MIAPIKRLMSLPTSSREEMSTRGAIKDTIINKSGILQIAIKATNAKINNPKVKVISPVKLLVVELIQMPHTSELLKALDTLSI